MKPNRLVTANLLLLALGLVACGEGGGSGVTTSTPTGNGPVVAHPEGSSDGMQALIQGTLSLSGGCLLVGEFPVIWPHGTTWDAENQTVELPDGHEVALGDQVRGGGGYPYLSDLRASFARPLADCPTNEYGEIAAFNADEEVTVIE